MNVRGINGWRRWRRAGLLAAALAASPGVASAIDVTVTVENLSPVNGVYMAPLWVGFHDGGFDLYDLGSAASPGVARMAEDGSPAMVAAEFLASGAGTIEGTLVGSGGAISPQIEPGESVSMTFMNVDGSLPSSRYFAYGGMVVPSNDAFIGNGDPTGIAIFDGGGNFVGASILVMGSMILDAGSEVNTEAPADTAFFGQMMPNTGPDENGVVMIHPGYHAAGSGGILDDPMFANADFKAAGYQLARITVTPEPTAGILLLMGSAALIRRRRNAAN